MGTIAEKYRIYLSGYEMQCLLDLTDPDNLDPSEVTEFLKTARVVLRKKMAEVDEGTANVDLQIKSKKPGKYSSTGLGFGGGGQGQQRQPTEEEIFERLYAQEEKNRQILAAGGKLPTLESLLLDPAFNFCNDDSNVKKGN